MKNIKSNAVLKNVSVKSTRSVNGYTRYSAFLLHYHYFGLYYYNGSVLVTGINFDKRITEEDWFNTSVIYFNVLSVPLSVTFRHDTIVSAQWFRH
jgi:hypothetical protein